jgi:hypothetical protein
MKYLSSMVDSLFGIGKWSSRVLMITTLYLANSVMMNTLSDKLPEAVMAAAPYISVVAAFVITRIIDTDLYKNLIASIASLMSGDFKTGSFAIKLAIGMSLALAFIRFGLSTTSTLSSAMFMAEESKEQIDTKPIEQAGVSRMTAINETRSTYMQQADDITRKAENRADKLVNDAINAKGQKWASYYSSGNAWFMSTDKPSIRSYRKNIEKAKAKAEQIITDAEKERASILHSLDDRLASLEKDQSIAVLGKAIDKQIEREESKAWIIEKSLFLIDIVASLMTIFCAFICSVHLADIDREIEYFFPPEPSLFDEMHNGAMAVWEMVVSALGWVAATLQLRGSSLMANVATTAESANAKRAEAIAQFRSTKTQSTAKVDRKETAKPKTAVKNEAANEAANEAKQPEKPVNIERKERKENNEDRKEQSKVAPEEPTQSGKNEAQKKALLQSLRRKKTQKDKATAAARAYRSNLSKGKGNAETNMAGLERKLAEAKSLQAEIAKVEFEITNLGYTDGPAYC